MGAYHRKYRIEKVSWDTHKHLLKRIRQRVFIEEQGVLPQQEWDELDGASHHFLALDEHGQAVGTARLTRSGKLGRLAVLQQHRGRGLGRMLVESVIELASELGLESLRADAQVYALGFYRKLGFETYGEEFLDALIPHMKVKLLLKKKNSSSHPPVA